MIPTRFDYQALVDFARNVEQRLNALETQDIDLSHRRVVNAEKSVSKFDYVTRFELDQVKAEIGKAISSQGRTTATSGALNSLTNHAIVLGDFANRLKSGTLGTTTTVLHGNASGDPAYAAVIEADITLADNTTDNVSSGRHGFAPKSPADATQFLNGAATPAFAQVKDSDLSTSDITTNDSSTSKHGFLKKLDNNAAHFMDGTGAWSTPSGSASDWVKLASSTLGSDTASISFTSISGSYKHLKIVAQLRSTVASTADNVQIQFNGDSTGAYDSDYVLGKNTVLTSVASHAQTSGLIGLCAGATATRSTQASGIDITIPNYAGTTFEKYATGVTIAHESNAASGMYMFTAGVNWTVSPAAITRVDIFAAGGNLKTGSVATLYGLT